MQFHPSSCSPNPFLCSSASASPRTTLALWSLVPKASIVHDQGPPSSCAQAQKFVTSGNLQICLHAQASYQISFSMWFPCVLSAYCRPHKSWWLCPDLLISVTIYVLNSLLPSWPPSLMGSVSCQHFFCLSSLVILPAMLLFSVHRIKKEWWSEITNGDTKWTKTDPQFPHIPWRPPRIQANNCLYFYLVHGQTSTLRLDSSPHWIPSKNTISWDQLNVPLNFLAASCYS